MKITEAIEKIKKYHRGIWQGKPIEAATTRDRILFGDPEQELTGVVTTCFASVEVIEKAITLGANLIICHEALFWNHGDHTQWLENNRTYQAKVRLMESAGIVVWRNHDYIHSGIPLPDGGWTDGIFYGWMKEVGWEDYLVSSPEDPVRYVMPETTVAALGKQLMEKLPLNGIKLIGSPDAPVKNLMIAMHIFGNGDNDLITLLDQEDIDTVIAMEVIDFTVAEYVRDASMSGRTKTIMAVGHFNVEEPGMAYMLHYLPDILGSEIPCHFVASTDMYHFLSK